MGSSMDINAVFKFLKAFLGAFYENGIGSVFWGVLHIFYNDGYRDAFKNYTENFGAGEWAVAMIFVILVFAAIAAVVVLAILGLRKLVRLNKDKVLPQDLVEECTDLKKQLVKMSEEKERILAMRLSDVGRYEVEAGKDVEDGVQNASAEGGSRFSKLAEIDRMYADDIPLLYNDDITLPEFCNRFRNFACSRLKLYYEPRLIRQFVAGMATTRLIILQGISGTGKTSLPYAMGMFLSNPATIAPVQPSWRDRSELFGYFNEFTKRFNETEVLGKLYEATWNDKIYLIVLDEMNIARVEYYFAEMLSILELPSKDDWVVDLVPSGWASDPVHIEKGRFRLPWNIWFVGTLNNDDSTFAISDKVYDRAMPININSKGVPFKAPYTDGACVSYKRLEALFEESKQKYKVSKKSLDKINLLDDYLIQHFRLAFGNRILKQIEDFVPVYVGCGGTETEALDHVVCNKIFRKFESLNLSYIRDEIDGLISYLDKLFGKDNMRESKEYLKGLKKLY